MKAEENEYGLTIARSFLPPGSLLPLAADELPNDLPTKDCIFQPVPIFALVCFLPKCNRSYPAYPAVAKTKP